MLHHSQVEYFLKYLFKWEIINKYLNLPSIPQLVSTPKIIIDIQNYQENKNIILTNKNNTCIFIFQSYYLPSVPMPAMPFGRESLNDVL